ncbi:MAG: HD domain-containing protein [Telluria sp.]
MVLSYERWLNTWNKLGLAAPGADVFSALIERYGEPHRRYHTARHLEECFGHLAELEDLAEHLGELEIALWFHDAVYDVRRSDNEEKSAEWAAACLRGAGGEGAVIERVQRLVLDTQRHDATGAIDSAILSDVDLWILGAPPERFREYDRQIRDEYCHVPLPLYWLKRKEVLKSFLKRERIFKTQRFFELYESQARRNLS